MFHCKVWWVQLNSNCGFIKEKCQREYHHSFLFLLFQFLFSLLSWHYLLWNEWGGRHFCLLFISSTVNQTLHFPEQSEHSSCETEPFLLLLHFMALDTQTLREKRSLQSLESVRGECQRQTESKVKVDWTTLTNIWGSRE